MPTSSGVDRMCMLPRLPAPACTGETTLHALLTEGRLCARTQTTVNVQGRPEALWAAAAPHRPDLACTERTDLLANCQGLRGTRSTSVALADERQTHPAHHLTVEFLQEVLPTREPGQGRQSWPQHSNMLFMEAVRSIKASVCAGRGGLCERQYEVQRRL